MGWVFNATPRPLYPRERPGTHCAGCWVGPRAGLDRCGKSRLPLGFDSRTVQSLTNRYTDCNIPAHQYSGISWQNQCQRNWCERYLGKTKCRHAAANRRRNCLNVSWPKGEKVKQVTKYRISYLNGEIREDTPVTAVLCLPHCRMWPSPIQASKSTCSLVFIATTLTLSNACWWPVIPFLPCVWHMWWCDVLSTGPWLAQF